MCKQLLFAAILLGFSVNIIAQNLENALPFSMKPSSKQSYFERTSSPDFRAYSVDEERDFAEYGGKVSVGISILDGFGIPVRYYINPNMVAEAGLYGGTVLLGEWDFEDDPDFESETSAMIGLGFSYFGDRFLKEKRRKRNKVRAHGIAARFRQKLGDYPFSSGSLGWAMETFKEGRTNRSFIFELGLQGIAPNFDYLGIEEENSFGLYLRCHWNFFLK